MAAQFYDDVVFNPQTHLLEFADVGLMSIYIADCDALATLGSATGVFRILGTEPDAEVTRGSGPISCAERDFKGLREPPVPCRVKELPQLSQLVLDDSSVETQLGGKRYKNRQIIPPRPNSPQPGTITRVQASYFAGPLPPPEVLARYNDVVPNGADRILSMAERQGAHRESLETKS
jgi:hypothetical protein